MIYKENYKELLKNLKINLKILKKKGIIKLL